MLPRPSSARRRQTQAFETSHRDETNTLVSKDGTKIKTSNGIRQDKMLGFETVTLTTMNHGDVLNIGLDDVIYLQM